MDLLRGLRQGMHQGPSLSGWRHHSNTSANGRSDAATTDSMDSSSAEATLSGMDTSSSAEDSGSYAMIVRMGYRELRFDVPVLVSEDTVFEIIRKRMGPPPAAAEFVKTLPTSTVSPDGTDDEGHTCVICQDEFTAGEGLTTMPCTHTFHSACLHPWLAMHNTCPTCRVPIPAEEDAFKKRVESEVSSGATAAEGEDESEGGVIMLSDDDVREMRQHVPVRNLKALIAQAGGESKGVVEKDELFLRYLQCLDRLRVRRQEQLRQHRNISASAA